MSASDVATAGYEAKLRLFRTAETLFVNEDSLHVSFGFAADGGDRPDAMAFMEIRTQQEPATLSTNRSRDEEIFVSFVVTAFRAGELDDDRVPTEAAFGYVRTLEQHIRQNDPTLGGLAHWCFLDNVQSMAATSADIVSQGRLVVIEAQFKARVRITG